VASKLDLMARDPSAADVQTTLDVQAAVKAKVQAAAKAKLQAAQPAATQAPSSNHAPPPTAPPSAAEATDSPEGESPPRAAIATRQRCVCSVVACTCNTIQ
jgi:hypothetical protein